MPKEPLYPHVPKSKTAIETYKGYHIQHVGNSYLASKDPRMLLDRLWADTMKELKDVIDWRSGLGR